MNPLATETLASLRHRELLAEAERQHRHHAARSGRRSLRFLVR